MIILLNNLFKLFKISYYKIGAYLITNPFIIYFILVFFFILKYVTYYFLIKNYMPNPLQPKPPLLMPSLESIKDFFKFKIIALDIKSNFSQYIKKIYDLQEYNINEDDINSDSNFLASIAMDYTAFEEKQQNYTEAIFIQSELKDNQQVTQPQFKVDTPMPNTIVLEKDILDNRLPFETPIDIVVTEEREMVAYIAQKNTLQGTILNTIYYPGTNGPRVYSNDVIFDLHIKIINIIKANINNFEVIDNKNAINFIRQEVHDYLIQYNLLNGLTMVDLQNTNNVINLLIQKLTNNYLHVTEDYEQFILSNISGAIIIEAVCHIEQKDLSTYYNDPAAYASLIETILQRFISF